MNRFHRQQIAAANEPDGAVRDVVATAGERQSEPSELASFTGVGDVLLAMQRACGNRDVQRLVPRPSGPVKRRLTLGPVSDCYEREADQVMEREGGGEVAGAPSESEAQHARSDPPMPRLHAGAGASDPIDPLIQRVILGARGQGQGISATVRGPLERSLGADFGSVRVHTDSRADTLSRALQARAFTTGQDIFFRRGEFQPTSDSGRRTLAHELTHVVQQTGPDAPAGCDDTTAAAPVQRLFTHDGTPITDGDLLQTILDLATGSVGSDEVADAFWAAASVKAPNRDIGDWLALRDFSKKTVNKVIRLVEKSAIEPIQTKKRDRDDEPNHPPITAHGGTKTDAPKSMMLPPPQSEIAFKTGGGFGKNLARSKTQGTLSSFFKVTEPPPKRAADGTYRITSYQDLSEVPVLLVQKDALTSTYILADNEEAQEKYIRYDHSAKRYSHAVKERVGSFNEWPPSVDKWKDGLLGIRAVKRTGKPVTGSLSSLGSVLSDEDLMRVYQVLGIWGTWIVRRTLAAAKLGTISSIGAAIKKKMEGLLEGQQQDAGQFLSQLKGRQAAVFWGILKDGPLNPLTALKTLTSAPSAQQFPAKSQTNYLGTVGELMDELRLKQRLRAKPSDRGTHLLTHSTGSGEKGPDLILIKLRDGRYRINIHESKLTGWTPDNKNAGDQPTYGLSGLPAVARKGSKALKLYLTEAVTAHQLPDAKAIIDQIGTGEAVTTWKYATVGQVLLEGEGQHFTRTKLGGTLSDPKKDALESWLNYARQLAKSASQTSNANDVGASSTTTSPVSSNLTPSSKPLVSSLKPPVSSEPPVVDPDEMAVSLPEEFESSVTSSSNKVSSSQWKVSPQWKVKSNMPPTLPITSSSKPMPGMLMRPVSDQPPVTSPTMPRSSFSQFLQSSSPPLAKKLKTVTGPAPPPPVSDQPPVTSSTMPRSSFSQFLQSSSPPPASKLKTNKDPSPLTSSLLKLRPFPHLAEGSSSSTPVVPSGPPTLSQGLQKMAAAEKVNRDGDKLIDELVNSLDPGNMHPGLRDYLADLHRKQPTLDRSILRAFGGLWIDRQL